MNLSILLMTVVLAAPPPSSVQDLAWLSGCWASVTGRIEGSEGGQAKGFDFPMERRPCT